MKTKADVINNEIDTIQYWSAFYLERSEIARHLELVWDNGYQTGIKELETAKNKCYNDGFNKGKETAYQELSGWTPREGKDMINDAYQRGLADAWEAARKITGTEKDSLSIPDLYDVFGTEDFDTISCNLSVQEVIEKIKAWEEKKNEIHVGDEVESCLGKWVVLNDYEFHLFGFDSGGMEHYEEKKEVKKTGRHFDQVEKLLKEMGE